MTPLSDLLAVPVPAWVESLSNLLKQPAPSAAAQPAAGQPPGEAPAAHGLPQPPAFEAPPPIPTAPTSTSHAAGGATISTTPPTTTAAGVGGVVGAMGNLPPGGGAGGPVPPAAGGTPAAAGTGTGGGGGGGGGGAGAAIAGGAGAVAGALGGIGSSTQQAQLALNTLQFGTALGGVGYGTTAANALGTVGNRWGSPTQTNQWAFNAPDALQGYSLLQQASASPNPYSTAGGQNVLGAMGAMNIANPAMSETQNAGTLAQVYNPQTAMSMAMRGYQAPSVQEGTGKQQPLPNVLQPFISQATKGGKTSMGQFATDLTPGQAGNVTLQNLFPGMTQDQISQLSQTAQMEYALGSGQKVGGAKGAAPKMSMDQINKLMGTQGLASKDAGQVKTAEATLGKYGFKQSDYQAIKAAAAPGEQAVSTTSDAYTKGLQQNTQMMKTLNSTIQKLINNIPGAKGVVGRVEGFLGNLATGGQLAAGSLSWVGERGPELISVSQDAVVRSAGDSVKLAKAMPAEVPWMAALPNVNAVGGGAAAVNGTSGINALTSKADKAALKSNSPSAKAVAAVKTAETQVGVPYTYGAEAPGKGFDCSALPQWAYASAGISLPRTAAEQYKALQSELVPIKQVTEGDLLFSAGAGTGMHEAMVVDNGRHIIEAKSVGTRIAITKYNQGDWKFAARPTTPLKGGKNKNAPAKGASKTNVVGGGAGSGSGAQVGAYAKSYATGLNHPYVTGGGSPSGWDCSGFSAWVYEKFKYFPESQGTRHGTSETQFADPLLQSAGAQVGALVFFDDGVYANPGHVGVMVDASNYAGADDPAEGTVVHGIGGNVGFRIPKGGFNGSGAAPAGGGGGGSGVSGAAVAAVLTALTSGGSASGGGAGAPGPGTGDTSSEGSTEETAAVSGALGGGVTAGGGATTASARTAAQIAAIAASGGSATAAAGGGSTANSGASQNAISIGKALMGMGFSKAAAAGIVGVIAGEDSTFDPEVGNAASGIGLIQWTGTSVPKGVKLQTGNAAADMKTQLGQIIPYIQTRGGSVAQLNSIAGTNNYSAAATKFSQWEAPAVPGSDIRLSVAQSTFAGLAAGGPAKAGTTAWVGERGPELVHLTGDAHVTNASDSARLMKSAMAQPAQGPWAAGPGASYNYSQMHPAYSGSGTAFGAGSGKGLNITCTINMNGGSGSSSSTAPAAGTSAAGMSVTGYDGAAAAQAFAKQLKVELTKMNLQQLIGTGVTS